jgi:two-component system alkaline phosphatase synthesis response regulator PhoP
MSREALVVIEDEPDIQEVIEYNLLREGFRVRSVGDGEEGLRLVQESSPALVLLDLMLPGLDGIEVCRRLKGDPRTRSIPIIMVTAKGEESDIVLGLGIGADDYVTKPFSPKELVGRVKAVLRRGPMRSGPESDTRVAREGIVIDPERHEVRVDGESVEFTAREFRILHHLASHPGRVFTRDQLLNHVMGDRAFVVDRNIDVHIRAVRKKLGGYRDIIETIRGVGYRFRDEE